MKRENGRQNSSDPVAGTETHHNQAITRDAKAKLQRTEPGKPARKVVALRLDERESAALDFLGGPAALKQLLCPEGICIRCRVESSTSGTPFDSLCTVCAQLNQESI